MGNKKSRALSNSERCSSSKISINASSSRFSEIVIDDYDNIDAIFDKLSGNDDTVSWSKINTTLGDDVVQLILSRISLPRQEPLNRKLFRKTFADMFDMNVSTFLTSLITDFDFLTLNHEKMKNFICICALLDNVDVSDEDDKFVNCIVDLCTSNKSVSSIDVLMKSASSHILLKMADKFRKIIFDRLNLTYAVCRNDQTINSDLLSRFELWYLKLIIPQAYVSKNIDDMNVTDDKKIMWSLLYNSRNDGISVNRFEHKVFGYRAPTVIFIRTIDNRLFAIGADEEWRLGPNFWGKTDSFIVQLAPKVSSLESGSQLIYFNTKIRSSPMCLQFGLDKKFPKLKISADFADVLSVEVWGCGCEKTQQNQNEQKNWEHKQAEKHAKVPLPGNWDENPDRALLELAGIKTEHAER